MKTLATGGPGVRGDTRLTRTRVVGAVASWLDPFWFRGKGRLLDIVCPRSGTAERTLFGVRISLDLSDWGQRKIFLGTYEPRETRWLRRYLRPGMIVVDVGANVGYYTLLARASVGPSGRVVAIEPAARPLAHLHEATTRFSNVSIIEAAAGAAAGEGVLSADESAGNDAPTLASNPRGSGTQVKIRTLDECLAALGIDVVDLLKIDVEGWEPQVLVGASHLLKGRRIRAVLCEFNDYWLRAAGSRPTDLWQLLHDAGFVDANATDWPPSFGPGSTDTRFFVLRDPRRIDGARVGRST